MGIRLKIGEMAERAGVNKAQLSRLTGLGTTTINELWDEDRDPRLSTLHRIARALGVHTCELFEETEEENIEALEPMAA